MNETTLNSAKNCHPSNGVFLMAEDNPADAKLVEAMLSKAFNGSYSVVCVDRFDRIVDAITDGTFSALILDMNLPGQSGVQNITELSSSFPDLPIVVLTGQDDLSTAVEALKEGAQDYLTKNNITPDILARSLSYAVDQKRVKKKLMVALNDSALRNDRLEKMVRHDPLTGLPNRMYFHDASTRILHRAKRCKKEVALLFFDLNGFKKVNDSYGHLVGDELLKQIARRLEDIVRDTDFMARLSGDEFVIITDCLDNREQVYPLVKRVLKAFSRPFDIDGHQIISSPSIGVSYYPYADSIDLLVKHADCAMYEAKKNQNYPVCFYTDKMAEQFSQNQKIELELSRAIKKKELSCNFQPIISVNRPNAIIVEALVRWSSDKLGQVSPADFIPVAEFTPAINGISRAVVDNAGEFYGRVASRDRFIEKISINVTASQLCNNQFCELFIGWLEEMQLPPERVCLEITERQIVQSPTLCHQQLSLLREKGVRVALDDFGTGYSSVTHLLGLPLDILKLDRVLIDHVDLNERNQAIIAGIIEMAHRLGMEVVAEGIERVEEYQTAITLGCDYLQGYYIARPLPLDQALFFFELFDEEYSLTDPRMVGQVQTLCLNSITK